MQQIIDRIQKLLALAKDRAASEGEASNAMEKVHALLSQHNLDMAMIEKSTINPDITTQHEFVELGNEDWTKVIYNSVADLYYCKYFVGHTYLDCKRATQHYFIGTQANAHIAKNMGEYLINTGRRLAKVDCKGMGRAYHNSFKQGYARRLSQRIREQKRASMEGLKKDDTGNNLPATLDLYEQARIRNQAVFASLGIGFKTHTVNPGSSMAGHRAGSERAESVGLHKQMGGQKATIAQLR